MICFLLRVCACVIYVYTHTLHVYIYIYTGVPPPCAPFRFLPETAILGFSIINLVSTLSSVRSVASSRWWQCMNSLLCQIVTIMRCDLEDRSHLKSWAWSHSEDLDRSIFYLSFLFLLVALSEKRIQILNSIKVSNTSNERHRIGHYWCDQEWKLEYSKYTKIIFGKLSREQLTFTLFRAY